jgi:hypothetical protein
MNVLESSCTELDQIVPARSLRRMRINHRSGAIRTGVQQTLQ